MQGYTFGDNEPRDTIALIYPPESVELFRKIGLIPKESCRPYIVSGAIKLLVGKFYKLLNSIYSPGVPDQMDWLGFCLIKEVLLAGENRSGKQSMAILMQNISVWLKIHSSEEQNLREVARQNGMSHAKFYSEWKKAFGITPLQYIINARLESAANLLRQTNLSIEQIVKTVNFSGTYAFHRKFAKEYAMTPGEYRAAHAPKD